MVDETAWLIVELAVLFFGVTFLVQMFQRRMGAERVRSWMGGRPVTAALKGIAIGFMTPFCTFTAVPMLIGMRQAGVPPAGYVAFVVAAPVLDPVLFGALVIIVGFEAALVYLAIAFVAALTLAVVSGPAGIERHMVPAEPVAVGGRAVVSVASGPGERYVDPVVESIGDPADGECGPTSCGAVGGPWRGWRHECVAAAQASVVLLRGMGPLLLLGVLLSLVIETLVPAEVAARITGANATFAIPVAAAIGTPLYVSTSLFVPIADSLRDAGVGIGAIVSLTIAGAGANLPEFVILSKMARPRIIAIFFAYVFGVAVVGGFVAQAVVGT